MAHRRTPSTRVRVVCGETARRSTTIALAAVLGLALGIVPRVSAVELDAIYGAQPDQPRPSAKEVLTRALDQLFGVPSLMAVIAERTRAGTEPSMSQFRVARHKPSTGTRVLIESLEPASIRGTRILQIEENDGDITSFLSVRSTDGERVQTNLRLADPFLCTWYEITEDERESKLGAMMQEELLGHLMDEIDGESVHRIVTRPVASRGYDRVEYAIAAKDFAILEYIHYLRRGDIEPTLIARVRRQDLVQLQGRVLPALIRYEDRSDGSLITAKLQHMQMPADVPDSLFQPRSFHRLSLDPYFGAGS